MKRPRMAPRIGCALGVLVLLLSADPLWARGPRMSESEKLQFEQLRVQQAEQACKESNYKAFFSLMVQSEVVRRKFTAEKVEYSEIGARGSTRNTVIARLDYDRFPIRMLDYQWRSARPLKPGDDQEQIVAELSTDQSGRVTVEWTRVHYRAPLKGEGSLGTPYDLDGKRYNAARPGHGRLVLSPAGNCWQLSADIRRASR